MKSTRPTKKNTASLSKLASQPSFILLIVSLLFIAIYLFVFTNRLLLISPTENIGTIKSNPYGPIEGWKVYSSVKYGYEVQYPMELRFEETTQLPFSTTFSLYKKTNPDGFGKTPLPTYYISVIPKDFENTNYEIYNFMNQRTIDAFFNAKIGDMVNENIKGPDNIYYTSKFSRYKKLSNINIDNQVGIVMDNTHAFEENERRVFIKKDNFTYMIGTYYENSKDLENFQKLLSTFRFKN